MQVKIYDVFNFMKLLVLLLVIAFRIYIYIIFFFFFQKSMFNLNDDDMLTHGGKALDEDNLDDRMGFSDDDDEQILDGRRMCEECRYH